MTSDGWIEKKGASKAAIFPLKKLALLTCIYVGYQALNRSGKENA